MSQDGFKGLRFPWRFPSQVRSPRDVRIQGPVGPILYFSVNDDGKVSSVTRVDVDMTDQELIDAINRYFGDTKRSREETRDGLKVAREEIDSLIELLDYEGG